jgi:hypothetical protein
MSLPYHCFLAELGYMQTSHITYLHFESDRSPFSSWQTPPCTWLISTLYLLISTLYEPHISILYLPDFHPLHPPFSTLYTSTWQISALYMTYLQPSTLISVLYPTYLHLLPDWRCPSAWQISSLDLIDLTPPSDCSPSSIRLIFILSLTNILPLTWLISTLYTTNHQPLPGCAPFSLFTWLIWAWGPPCSRPRDLRFSPMSRLSSVLSSTGPLHVPAFLTLSDHSQNFDLLLSRISITIVQICTYCTADGFEKSEQF